MEKEIMSQYQQTTAGLLSVVNSFSQETLNETPFEGSWTAAQVVLHVIKSNRSIAQALSLAAKPAHRAPAERISELRDIFLNFTTKLKTPDFIIPEPGIYEKYALMDDLQDSIAELRRQSAAVDLSEAIKHPAFGDITKLELLHFVEYHTERHINQLNKIYGVVENRDNG